METGGQLTALKAEQIDSKMGNLETMSGEDFANYICNSLLVENAVVVGMTGYSWDAKCPVKPVNCAVDIKIELDDMKLLRSCTDADHETRNNTYQSSCSGHSHTVTVSTLESQKNTLEQRENMQLSSTSCVMIDQPTPTILVKNGDDGVVSAISAEQQFAMPLKNLQSQTLQRGNKLRSNTLEESEQEVGLVVSSIKESSETCSASRHCSSIGTTEDNTTLNRRVDARATLSCQVHLHRCDETRSEEQPRVCNVDSLIGFQNKKSLETQFVRHPLSHGRDLVQHTHEYNYVCAECTASFTCKQFLVEHVTSHTSNSSFLCRICDEAFEHKRCLMYHSRYHFEKGRVVRSVKKSFVSNSKRISQTQRHTGEKQHVCRTCSKGFARKGHLNEHVRTHTGNKPHECTTCSKKFARTQHLIRHIRTHTGEKPYACRTCSKEFAHKRNLNEHVRTHTGEKPHVCTTCSKKFARTQHLIRHIRTHTGEKPHVCTTCSKKFARTQTLIMHMRTHTGEKPYLCATCSKGFAQKSHLISHTRTHTGEKPNVCATCSKAFALEGDLNKHTRTHTGENHICVQLATRGSHGKNV